ncbi:HK97 family phage prohead protease [Myroides odoratus]|uniref:HK97 family phage prohead protease n=1 Tax=Myroides odoratus TaxID=256 RepID=UPI0007657FF1|nr:HK97 family phage prohead protease [Myroides odoratus]
MNKIERYVYARAVSEEQAEKRQAEFVISTETPDTYGTIFELGGWNLERYNRNPVVLYAHKSHSDNPDMVIGTSEVRIDGEELVAIVTFEEAEINPIAEKVYQKVKAGTLRMASVGAEVHEGRFGDFEKGENPDLFRFTNQDLLEWSIVPVGSNPDALKRSADNLEYIKKRFSKKEESRQYPSLAVREAQMKLNKRKLEY